MPAGVRGPVLSPPWSRQQGPAGPSNSQVWNTYIAGALTTVQAAGRFTPDGKVTVTRVQVQLQTAPAACRTNAVLLLSNGTVTTTLTLSAAANDSGPLSLSYPSSTAISVGINVAANCRTNPQNANIVVQYKGQ